MAKWVYVFGDGKAEGKGDMRNLLGGKGAGLAEMANLGLPVPAGFTISTAVCVHYMKNEDYPTDLAGEVKSSLEHIEQQAGRKFGDPKAPLLLSCRSGARASMVIGAVGVSEYYPLYRDADTLLYVRWASASDATG